MANKPGDQGAPGGGASTFAAPNTAENDAEFDMCTIWPALHLSTRRVCAPLSADTTKSQFVRASFKGRRGTPNWSSPQQSGAATNEGATPNHCSRPK